MNKSILSIFITILFQAPLHAIDIDEVVKLGLPVLIIETIDQEEPTCDFVFAPEGANGIGSTNNTKVPGRVVLIKGRDDISDKSGYATDTLFDSGDYSKDLSGMTIRIRGNTSAYYSSKKPFKIELEKKGDLLARGDSAYYDKNWALLRDGNDVLHTMIGNMVNRLVGMPYTPAYQYVNVFFNGDYRGIYMLTETIRRNADCRLNVSKQSGYIIERDAYWWNEPLYFKTPMGMEYTFKYPDDKDVTDEQQNYIQSVIETMEQHITDGSYDRYMDLQSFAAWMLAHDLLGTKDSGGSNIYLSKYDSSDTSLVQMTTMWDFGSIMHEQCRNKWSTVHYDSFFYYPQLFDNKNPAFVNAYIELWNKLSPTLLDHIVATLLDFKQSPTAESLQLSRPYEFQRWNYYGVSVDTNIDNAISWFTERLSWLATAISTTRITTTTMPTRPCNHVYSMSGQKADGTYSQKPGIYIKNGRKFLVK